MGHTIRIHAIYDEWPTLARASAVGAAILGTSIMNGNAVDMTTIPTSRRMPGLATRQGRCSVAKMAFVCAIT